MDARNKKKNQDKKRKDEKYEKPTLTRHSHLRHPVFVAGEALVLDQEIS